MKLNTKRIIYIGLAFFTILMLWQVYNSYCPLMLRDLLTDRFSGDVEYLIGIIMAIDNILALFMLPLFGNLSDKTKSKYGKRMPYIFIGTILSLIIFPFIPIFYINNNLVGTLICMALILLVMNMYRNPAVSLMPDITPKPLRAKANGIINLIGYIGAIFAGALALIFTDRNSYIYTFAITSILMAIALIILIMKINENQIAKEVKDELEEGEKISSKNIDSKEEKELSKKDKKDLVLIILSVFIWFMGFNALETFWSSYGEIYLKTDSWSLGTIIMTVFSILTFVPAGNLTSKIGRKRIIQIGLGCIIFSLGIASFIKSFNFILMFCFALCGIGWAMVNVASYPMVVELASNSKNGKYTGYYYTSSMIAQSITPCCIGLLLGKIGWKYFFIYSFVFMIVALIVFSFVSNNQKYQSKKGLELFDQD